MFKKMMLLAMAVGALVALAGPATASASPNLQWETGTTVLGSETPGDEVVFHGTLSSTKQGLKISCDATATVDLWNDKTLGAHGEVTSLTLGPDPTETHGCTVGVNVGGGTYVDVTECHVEATANFNTNPPIWTVTTSTTETGHHATIDHAEFTNKFTGPGCLQHLGIPAGTEVSDTGDATGEVVDVEIAPNVFESCIKFTNAGTFVGESTIDGELCPTEGEQGPLRLTTIEEE